MAGPRAHGVETLEVDVAGTLGRFELATRFSVEARGVTALFGASGAGKTSVINMIAGLLSPSRGRIAVGDVTLFDSASGVDLPPERRAVGYVFQDSRLFPHLGVRANLEYGMRRAPPDGRVIPFERVIEALDLGHLLERRTQYLSGGERQRVAIGRALLRSPRLLLMDEPLASLDAPRQAEILPLIERLRDGFAVPIVYVSHRIEEIVRLADTLVVMRNGHVTAAGPLEEVASRLDERIDGLNVAAGTVIPATVGRTGFAHGLAELDFPGGSLRVPDPGLAEGSAIRVHIRARDVSIALSRPADISVLNVFAGPIVELRDDGGAQIEIGVAIGEDPRVVLWARVTKHSAVELDLGIGRHVHALVKAVAIDPLNIAWRGDA